MSEVWARHPDATIVVYPHYFSGAKLRFSFTEATASKQPFDPRWTLFFTPHSASLEPTLIAQARGSWWWNEAPCRFDVANIRAGAKQARDAKCSGYIPSLECYSYVPVKTEFGEPWLVGKRQIPFGFGWLKDGANPYRELPVRAIRLVYRAEHGRLDAKKRALLREQLAHVRSIAERHREALSGGAKELHRIAQWLADQWTPENTGILSAP